MKRNYDLLTVLALGVLSEIGCSTPVACSVSAAAERACSPDFRPGHIQQLN
jgi:hypothetical protein